EQMAAEMGIRSAGMAPRAAAPSQSSGPWGNAGGNSNGGSGYRCPDGSKKDYPRRVRSRD
ncbi:hypothetical protein F9L03_26465, partial [Brucella lupini]